MHLLLLLVLVFGSCCCSLPSIFSRVFFCPLLFRSFTSSPFLTIRRNFRENKSSEERIRERKDSRRRQQQKRSQVMIVVSLCINSTNNSEKKGKDNKSLISNPRVASSFSSLTSFPLSSSRSLWERGWRQFSSEAMMLFVVEWHVRKRKLQPQLHDQGYQPKLWSFVGRKDCKTKVGRRIQRLLRTQGPDLKTF